MKIIPPHKIKSAKVVSIEDLVDSKEMIEFLEADNFKGNYKSGFALHHSQVNREPLNYFVVHRHMIEFFPAKIICNPKILKRESPVQFQEACLSFPFRGVKETTRAQWIRCEADIIFKGKLHQATFELEGIPAFIMQHEVDHGNGRLIYGS